MPDQIDTPAMIKQEVMTAYQQLNHMQGVIYGLHEDLTRGLMRETLNKTEETKKDIEDAITRTNELFVPFRPR